MNENTNTVHEDRLIDLAEAEHLLSLSRASIQRLITSGKLTAIRPGGINATRLRLSEVRRYM